MIQKFVSLVGFEGELYALTEDGTLYRIFKDHLGVIVVSRVLKIEGR